MNRKLAMPLLDFLETVLSNGRMNVAKRFAFQHGAIPGAMCRDLYEHRGWLWTFVRHEAVEPTNNAGERSLRHEVIGRKLSFGTQSAAGSRFVETMSTVIESCRQQRRKAFAFLTAAIESHLAHQPLPSLLPGA
jgi:transposase